MRQELRSLKEMWMVSDRVGPFTVGMANHFGISIVRGLDVICARIDSTHRAKQIAVALYAIELSEDE